MPTAPDPRLPRTAPVITLLWVGALGILAYWVSYFTGGEVHATDDLCYHVFERNFPLPDGFVALCCAGCAMALRRRHDSALLWGLLAAGGFFFLGLIDVSYNLWNGMYLKRNAAMAAEIVINLFCLGFATVLSRFLWLNRETWNR